MEPIKITLTFERSSKRYHVYRLPAGTILPEKLYVLQEDVGAGDPPATLVMLLATEDVLGDAVAEAFQRGVTEGRIAG